MPDMTPRGDRSIRNIPVPSNHRHTRPSVSPGQGRPSSREMYEEDFTERPVRIPQRKKSRWFLWSAIIVVIVCGIGGILLSTLFAGATIVASPRTASVTAPATIAAQLNAPIGTLPYQIITTSRTASTSVAANGTTHATRAASGVATIYNNYSTQSQDLIANTRFEAPDGKIYRIHSVLTVPGASKNADGSLNPGSISTSLFADQPGAEYNRGSTQFTIPGFKGDPRYTKFYAQAGSITNGFVGTEPAVASSTLASAKSAMEQGLQNALRSAAATGIPVEFLPVPGTLQITYGTVEATAGQNGQVILSQSAQASADIVRAADLAAAIARQEVQGYNGEAVGFADNTQIAIALASSSKTTEGALQLQLSGTPTLVWQFDPNSLKQALLGKNKSQFESIIQSFAPAIECSPKTPCNASLRPFWKQNFPSDPAKITVVSPLPKQ